MEPLIVLTARYMQNGTNDIYYDNCSYFHYVKKNGGMPALLPFMKNEEEAEAYASKADGLLISGGEDCDPSIYHEKNTCSLEVNRAMDDADILLYHAFRKQNKPVLGICRGIQVINIAEGGTLIQDLKKDGATAAEHNQRKRGIGNGPHDYCHKDHFRKGSVLASIYGSAANVNSFHHQAVKTPAPSFLVSAISEDGIIEGMEKENVLAVQWHPERLDDEGSAGLMQYFLDLCRKSVQ